MPQSEDHIELPEMPLPPEPPPEEDPPIRVELVLRDLPPDSTPTSALQWPAQQEFDSRMEAFEWAYYQNKGGGPRYKVQSLRNGKWEAIQAWMSNY